MTALIPPKMPCLAPRSPRVISRPPANRSMVRGNASRNAATARSASDAGSTSRSPNGVPGRGLRKFSGTSSGSSSARFAANSARCSRVSPIPRMPPQQTSMPASRTIFRVSQRSSQLCVVTTLGKCDFAVSRLWL
ncbi:Uncharacterised protein [Mycobacteroides abscessus subsp. abscessus]|nr:Uncharacterised protein [Mycobacteroides abscessus subsp. abscessus]